MTISFSWTDTAQIALSRCVPCLHPVSSFDSLHINRRPNSSLSGEERPEPYNPTINRVPRARPDELHGILLRMWDSSENMGLFGECVAGGGLRLRLRQGLTLVRNPTLTLNPNNRKLYPPLLQQSKTTKSQIWTEVSTRTKSQ